MVGRIVSLVVCDEKGEVAGELEPFAVGTPWWQDVEPIQQRFGSLAVLRVLEGSPRPQVMGAAVRYLAQRTSEPVLPLRPTPHVPGDEDHELRMPWARPGGPQADLAWAAGIAEPCGPAVQHRTWNLSAIWSFPTRRGRVWLKCVPWFFAHEAQVVERLRGQVVPLLLAAHGYRLLLGDMPGRDGHDATPEEASALVERLVQLQLSSAPVVGDLLRAGVPDARWPALLEALATFVTRRAPHDPHLQRLLETATERVARIERCGLPDVIVHGDAHAGNARTGGAPVWFDWGDSRVGNPLLDLAVLERLDSADRDILTTRWLAAWARAVPGSDPALAWALVRPLAVLRQGAVYQMFLDNIEPSERIYHVADVEPALHRASRLVAAELR